MNSRRNRFASEVPVTGLESSADRVERYLRYFTLSDGQLQMLCSRMTSEIDDAVERRKDGRPANSLSMIDSRISSSRLPEGQWRGAAGAVDFSGCSLKVGHAVYNGATVKLTSSSGDLRDMKKSQYAKGLADAEATALELFDSRTPDQQLMPLAQEFRRQWVVAELPSSP